MANPPGGPLSGGMEPVQDYARRDIQEKKATQQQQPVQREQLPPQEKQSSNREDLEAAARQKNLEQNDRVKEARAEEAKKSRTVQTPEKQALAEIAKDLAPKENSNRDQQQQLQNQQKRGGQER